MRDEEKTFVPSTFAILTFGALGMACLIALLPAAGHDQMWCLYAARLVLHGCRLYGSEIFESNPPLIVWLSTIPAGLAAWLHLPDTAVGKLLVLVLEAAVAAWSWHLLRNLVPNPRTRKSLAWPLAFVFVAVFVVMPARDFGQRDHLLVLLCLPYVLSAMIDAQDAEARAVTGWRTVAIGLAAGVGLALKPHQALIPIAVEATLIVLRSRRQGRLTLQTLRRPAPWTIAACGLAYVLAICAFTPEYFTQVVPVLRETYWAFGHLTLGRLILESPQLHILAAITLATLLITTATRATLPPDMSQTTHDISRTAQDPSCFMERLQPCHKNPRSEGALASEVTAPTIHQTDSQSELSVIRRCLSLIRANPRQSAVALPGPAILTTAGLAATLAYYAQGTGWYYQQLPALSFLALAITFLAIEAAERSKLTLPSWTPKAATALTLLALALTTHFAGYPFTAARSFPIDTPDPSFFASLPPGTPVATLTTTVDYTVPPAFRYRLILAQRYPHLWMLPALLRAETQPPPQSHLTPAQLTELTQLQRRMMLEDLIRWRPQLILVERCQDPAVHCQVLEDRHDDLLAWFLRDPALRAEFAAYRYLRSAGPFDAYVRR